METYKENGRIIKPFRYDAGDNRREKGEGALIINTQCNTIDVKFFKGPMPFGEDIIMFILADRDVRRMIRSYQQNGRVVPYSLRHTIGMSGRYDVYINFYTPFGLQIRGKKLFHESCFDKLNEGWYEMYIGDFVELFCHLQSFYLKYKFECMNPRVLRKRSRVRYIPGYFCDTASTNVSKII